MSGVPISAMTAQTTLADTDEFPFVIGSNLGDNRKITWANLKLLLQTYGNIEQTTQTTNYTNTNSSNAVIPNLTLLLTEGTWLIDFSAGLHAGASAVEMTHSILYNTNPLLTSYDPSDTLLSGSLRSESLNALQNSSITSKGIQLTVPAGSTYIIKLDIYEATGQSYTVNQRVLTALKTL